MTMSTPQKASYVALVVSVIVLSLKVYAYIQTSSAGVLSDAVETIINVLTAIIAIFVIRYSLTPADDNHPYGHGKIEYFSAAFEGGLILFAALAVIFESSKTLISGSKIQDVTTGIIYIALASIINAIAGWYLYQTGKKAYSEALKASGVHLISDVKTTVGVIIGLMLFHFTGLTWIDSVTGIVVGLFLMYDAYKILKANLGGLLDESDSHSIRILAQAMSKNLVPELIDFHRLRIIRSGQFHHVDAHVVVPEYLDINQMHTIIEKFERSVISDYPCDGELALHTDPCHQQFCKVCSMPNCPIRKADFVQRRELNAETITLAPMHPKD